MGLSLDPDNDLLPDSSTGLALHWHHRGQGSSLVEAWISETFHSLVLK